MAARMVSSASVSLFSSSRAWACFQAASTASCFFFCRAFHFSCATGSPCLLEVTEDDFGDVHGADHVAGGGDDARDEEHVLTLGFPDEEGLLEELAVDAAVPHREAAHAVEVHHHVFDERLLGEVF